MATKKKTEENKPSFADKKTWAAYLVLEAVAKDREYREIGVSLASNLVGGTLGLTKRTTTSVRDMLHRLGNPPYNWIYADSGQITVKPKAEVLKVCSGGADDN